MGPLTLSCMRIVPVVWKFLDIASQTSSMSVLVQQQGPDSPNLHELYSTHTRNHPHHCRACWEATRLAYLACCTMTTRPALPLRA